MSPVGILVARNEDGYCREMENPNEADRIQNKVLPFFWLREIIDYTYDFASGDMKCI